MHHPRQFAGIIFNKGFAIDGVIAQAVDGLKSRGIAMAGVIQTCGNEDCDHRDLRLESITGRWSLPIMQKRGALSSGCSLDYSAVAEASLRIAADIRPETRIVVLNRFGRAEAEGNGFRSILEKCLEEGKSALCAVRNDYAREWEEFHGGLADILLPEPDAILEWCLARELLSTPAE
jgi:hypothetical protein